MASNLRDSPNRSIDFIEQFLGMSNPERGFPRSQKGGFPNPRTGAFRAPHAALPAPPPAASPRSRPTKDVRHIAKVSELAGLARRVAHLKPLVCIKG